MFTSFSLFSTKTRSQFFVITLFLFSPKNTATPCKIMKFSLRSVFSLFQRGGNVGGVLPLPRCGQPQPVLLYDEVFMLSGSVAWAKAPPEILRSRRMIRAKRPVASTIDSTPPDGIDDDVSILPAVDDEEDIQESLQEEDLPVLVAPLPVPLRRRSPRLLVLALPRQPLLGSIIDKNGLRRSARLMMLAIG